MEIQLRNHFLPYGIERVARSKLRQLKQTGTVASYSSIFMQTVVHLPKMDMDDKIEAFIEGLNNAIYREVVLKDFSNLQKAMDYAVFVESRLHHRGPRYGSNLSSNNYNFRFSTKSANTTLGPSTNTSSSSVPMELTAVSSTTEIQSSESELNAMIGPLKKLTDAEREQLRREGKCFRCRNRGHLSRDCPKSKNGLAQQ